jgi:2-oxoglutarate ferredoxin oxidoreductase subunit beta
MKIDDFKSNDEISWCPGCGNFGILNALKKALENYGKKPNEILLVSGIGQAAKLPHYIKCNCFNGLHGRALPVAVGAKLANPELTVIVTTGDGDCYGEGGNHLIHNIRRNVDITLIVHNNQIYGLTKGQASPTTEPGYITNVQVNGVILEPFHSLEFALAMGVGFIARGFSKNTEQLSTLITEAINYKGFSLVEVLQPCVSFNKKNTYDWYSSRIYNVNDEKKYNTEDKMLAYQKASEWEDRIPIGIIYKSQKKTYGEKSGLDKKKPVIEENIENIDMNKIIKDFY